MMTFLIKKRIITGLFIDRTAALYIGKTRIVVTNIWVVSWEHLHLVQKWFLGVKNVWE